MLTDDVLRRFSLHPVDLPNAAWVAGAAAGLEIMHHRSPQWLWGPFLDDVVGLLEFQQGVLPAPPGTSPDIGDGSIGSALDALGGYVSIMGEVCPEGLYFKVPLEQQQDVMRLLSLDSIYITNGEVVIPNHELPAFIRLVPIHGPVADSIIEEELI
ncbi:MAG: hypothetical protein ACFFD6_10355 [Candidatus Thorarchaeota archaeon]